MYLQYLCLHSISANWWRGRFDEKYGLRWNMNSPTSGCSFWIYSFNMCSTFFKHGFMSVVHFFWQVTWPEARSTLTCNTWINWGAGTGVSASVPSRFLGRKERNDDVVEVFPVFCFLALVFHSYRYIYIYMTFPEYIEYGIGKCTILRALKKYILSIYVNRYYSRTILIIYVYIFTYIYLYSICIIIMYSFLIVHIIEQSEGL